DAQLAEQLLGEWLQAVLVRDDAAVEAVRQWHQRTEPGPLVLLPCAPGPRRTADGHPLADELRVDGPAAAWVRALLAGHEVLDGGRALRRANGAVYLAGAARGGPNAARGGGRDGAGRPAVEPAGGGGGPPCNRARRARASRSRAGAAGRAARRRARPAGRAGGAAGGGARATGALAGRGRASRGPSRGGPCPCRAGRRGRGGGAPPERQPGR